MKHLQIISLTISFGLIFCILSCSSVEKTTSSNIVFLTNSIDSLEDVAQLTEFKNKSVYVDIWGPNCAPCLKEFEKTLDVRQQSDKEILYISYEGKTAGKRVELINKYNLKGFHLEISSQVVADILINEMVKYKQTSGGLPLNYFISNDSIVKAPRLSEYFGIE